MHRMIAREYRRNKRKRKLGEFLLYLMYDWKEALSLVVFFGAILIWGIIKYA